MERVKGMSYENVGKKELANYATDFARLQYEQLSNTVSQQGINLGISELDLKQKGVTFQSVVEEKILNNKLLNQNLTKGEIEIWLKNFERELRNLGVSPNDPAYIRLAERAANELWDTIRKGGQAVQDLGSQLKSYINKK